MVEAPQPPEEHPVKIRIIPVAAGLAAAAGLAITGASLASAESGTATTAASSYGQTQGESAPPNANGNTDPSKPMRSDEKLLTGDVAAKVTAAAKAKEPKATIERVESDSDGVYEVHMVRADGTPITVQVDKGFTVTHVQEGGPGGPGGQGPARAGQSGPLGKSRSATPGAPSTT
jgi:hypothetical protein